jgi:hypothetical protein
MRRTSDADRERVARLLRRRWIEGYLSLETFELRLGRAYAAHHGGELSALVGDLPRLRSRAVALRDGLVRWLDAAFPKRPVAITFPPASRTTGGFLVGRSPICDLVLDDRTVSRRHAELRRDGDAWVLLDLGSTNGTWVNGWRIREAEVGAGDQVALGHLRVVFEAPRGSVGLNGPA